MKKLLKSPLLLVHGGCGEARPTALDLAVIRKAIEAGYFFLKKGSSSIDAVEAAIVILERSGHFNAGKGAKRQIDGVARMDASLMNGKELSAGAVAAMEGVATPIRVARLVMEKTPHLLLVGTPALRLAELYGIEALSLSARRPRPVKEMIPREWKELAGKLSKLGTVGAVARDLHGDLAAGTSTGGVRLMLPGRVGDSSLIGAGTYADNASGAVSMTGEGEAIIRAGLAKEITFRMEQGLSPDGAGRRSLARMRKRVSGEAGAIILSATGDFALLHTTPFMAGGYRAGRRMRVAGRFQQFLEE